MDLNRYDYLVVLSAIVATFTVMISPNAQVVDCQSDSVTSLEAQHTIIFKQPEGCSSYKAGDLSIEPRSPMLVPDGLPEPSLVPEEYGEPVGP